MFVSLPCGTDDPTERIEIIRSGTKGAKSEHNALGADVLLNWAEHATPNVFSAAARTYTRLRLADRHRPIHSLVISNVPGPDFPLYLGGAELVAGFPLGPVMDGAGLNVTVMSYRGVLNWGLMACAETVPGVASIAVAIPDALDELRTAAGLGPATPAGIVAKGPVRRRTAAKRARPRRRRRSCSPCGCRRSHPGRSCGEVVLVDPTRWLPRRKSRRAGLAPTGPAGREDLRVPPITRRPRTVSGGMAAATSNGQAHRVTNSEQPMGDVNGYVHPSFAPVASYFGRLFNAGSRGGGALSVRLHGQPVVDIWAGFADRSRSLPWKRDTVTVSFSTTKGVASTAVHRLADRGLIDYDAPVASYWPEFAAAGKGSITVRQLMSHQAGLHSMTDLAGSAEELLDHLALEEKLAARPSDPRLGHPCYHAITYGWLMAGLARRVTGLGMADLVRTELAEPLETNGLGIGMPPDGLRRVAPLLGRTPPVRPTPPLFAGASARSMPMLRKVELTRRFLEALYVPHFDELFTGPSPSLLNTEMPSVNGLLSAHGLAKLYAIIANEGEVRARSAVVAGNGSHLERGPDQSPRLGHRHADELAHGLSPGRSAAVSGRLGLRPLWLRRLGRLGRPDHQTVFWICYQRAEPHPGSRRWRSSNLPPGRARAPIAMSDRPRNGLLQRAWMSSLI